MLCLQTSKERKSSRQRLHKCDNLVSCKLVWTNGKQVLHIENRAPDQPGERNLDGDGEASCAFGNGKEVGWGIN